MNILDLFVNSYSRLRNYGMPYWVTTPIRRFVRMLAYRFLPTYLNKPHKINQERCNGLIVSLTSFPARINDVWQVIECMKRQTLIPEKIILWLSKEQFYDYKSIPESLRIREDETFCIRFVEGDIRSHKKYYYVSKEYPDKLVFLIDDDIYYDSNIIKRSMEKYEFYGKKIIVCNYGSQIEYNDRGVMPYSQWPKIEGGKIGRDIFFGSGGGTLFRPSDMYKDLTNIDLAIQLTPVADDIWLNVMALKSNLVKIILPNGPLLSIDINDNMTLSSINNGDGRNDQQINAIKMFYGDVFNFPQDTNKLI